jgi:hypothetical protein
LYAAPFSQLLKSVLSVSNQGIDSTLGLPN